MKGQRNEFGVQIRAGIFAVGRVGLVLLLLLTCFIGTTRAQASGTPLLDAKALLADVDILRQAYTTLHPGLYRYNTPAQIDQAFERLASRLRTVTTLKDAYLAFSLFAAEVRCGHTYTNFYNQKKTLQQSLFTGPRVPFYFRWISGKMIVTRSFSKDSRIKSGTEIVSINGVPSSKILARLKTIARADGSNDAKREAYLEVQGHDRYEAFDVFLPLFFDTPREKMQLLVKPYGASRSLTLTEVPLTYEQRLAAMKGEEENQNRDVFQFRFLDEGTALLVMPSWALYNSKWDWKSFLDRSFENLIAKGARDLIIDIRSNEGGQDIGDVVISHLSKEPVPRESLVRRVRYRSVPAELRPYLDTWDKSFFDWGSAAGAREGDFFRLRRDADDDPGGPIQPALPYFPGRVWVLTSATNSSATFEFAQTIRRNKLGRLVGQTTGGNQRGINGGCFFFLRLPNSGIELDLPLIGQFPLEARPDAGLKPDIQVVPSVEDIAHSIDSELAAVQKEIRKLKEAR